MYYLAYGSNLSRNQMAIRCPDAKVVGKAMLENYKLVFRTHANVERHSGSKVPVIVWDISDADEHSLDRYEGYPRYYIKKYMKVKMTDLEGKKPKKISAMIYIMTNGREKFAPHVELFQYYS